MPRAQRIGAAAPHQRISLPSTPPRRRPSSLRSPTSELLMPCRIGDYTDFYASIHHATNVGSMFRPDNPLLPNYKWVPVGYHGRASSVVVSGTPVRRPCGQTGRSARRPAAVRAQPPAGLRAGGRRVSRPRQRHGRPDPDRPRPSDHLFGLCLLNDWSARDIQAWEYQPLGPFLAKNFATSVSPWVVTAEALEPFRCARRPARRGRSAAAAASERPRSDLRRTTSRSKSGCVRRACRSRVRISRGSFAIDVLDVAQMIAHHTSQRLPISARRPDRQRHGLRPGEIAARLPPGAHLARHRAAATADGRDAPLSRGRRRSHSAAAGARRPAVPRIGFGECRGVVLPAAAV